MTVWENVAFPLQMTRKHRYSKQDISTRVQNVLATVGLEEYFQRSAHQLSGGQQQRLSLARALVSEPKLLLLDEPSAGMTHDETRELMSDILLVRERNKDLTIIIVEHEMGVIERITDRCIVLNFGRKIAEGPYREVASDAQVQEAYLGVA
jgi:ABC-type branched-subunit amino acid transport system ATPase component